MAYSRATEREADAQARQLMRSAGLDPARMALLFERLDVWRAAHRHAPGSGLPIALASHPTDAERIAFFRDRR